MSATNKLKVIINELARNMIEHNHFYEDRLDVAANPSTTEEDLESATHDASYYLGIIDGMRFALNLLDPKAVPQLIIDIVYADDTDDFLSDTSTYEMAWDK
jgi:hypothetical protein